MGNSFLEKNLNNLKTRFPNLVRKIENADSLHNYTDEFILSKTNLPVPVLNNGKALYSKYDPEKESKRLFLKDEEFVLFCGIGSGIHIREFLNLFKNNYCAITETNFANFKFLFNKFDFSEIILSERCIFLHPFSDHFFEQDLISTYLPILYGNLTVKILRPWEDYYNKKIPKLKTKINSALEKIKADVSTQTHFGKIWMRNIFSNLKTASNINPTLPKIDTNKTAYILGAGPSLENCLDEILKNRNKLILFATDTAFSVLNSYNIEADFFISIDPQIISFSHSFPPFSSKCVGIFDLCANPILVRQFKKNGNKFFFGIGGHPLAQLAGQYSPFPNLITTAGTVAVTAKFVATALGTKTIEYAGLDFAYTHGKAYSNETYLSKLFFSTSARFSPLECKFVDLMFRSPVDKIIENNKITYTTKLLNSYKIFFNEINKNEDTKKNAILWAKSQFKTFPYNGFINMLKKLPFTNLDTLTEAFLPYFAYKTQKKLKNNIKKSNLELVISTLSEYTGI